MPSDESEELDVAVPADLAAGGEVGALTETLRGAVGQLWQELGLRSPPDVVITAGSDRGPAAVTLASGPLPVSARTRELVLLAATGALRSAAEPSDVEDLLRARMVGSDPVGCQYIMTSLVDAALRASTGRLIRREAAQLAEEIISRARPRGSAPGLDIVAHGIGLAADLGVAPSQYRTDRDIEFRDARDAYDVCEVLVDLADSAGNLSPRIEMSAATLRRLSTSPAVTGGLNSWPQGIFATSDLRHYGLSVPEVALHTANDLEDGRFRTSLGPVRCTPHLVLPDHVRVVNDGNPDAAQQLDPLYGDRWSVIDVSDPAAQQGGFGPAAFLARSLHGDIKRHMGLWAMSPASDPQWPPFRGALGDQMGRRAKSVLRWLLADGAAVENVSPLIEGIAACLAAGDESAAAMVESARAALGGAVLGLAPTNVDVDAFPLDDAAISQALQSDSAMALLDHHPQLLTSTGQIAVTCPAGVRAEVQRLLRPLSDVVMVCTADELRGTILSAAEALAR